MLQLTTNKKVIQLLLFAWLIFGKLLDGGLINSFITLNFFNMGNILYIIAVILVIIWAISFLGGYYTGGLIHILLVIAIIAIVYKLVTGRNAV